ncbi:MAG: Cu(I)-responsive transcriptional regulator, partial [Hyphomicrobiales bacterium]|nr:Cu(I)-responsive transcriptional regulator [Hyphomicrobiales bacterium]
MNVSIGEAAKVSGVSAKMIRYYESIGLIAAPRRSAAGYRFYDERDVQTLRFVRRARDLGFQVEDIGKLLELWRDGARSSADVKRLAEHHIAELEGKIAALQAMQRTLEQLACACHGDERPDCPILEDLSAG